MLFSVLSTLCDTGGYYFDHVKEAQIPNSTWRDVPISERIFSEGSRPEWGQGSQEKLQKSEMSFLGAISQSVLSLSKKSVVRKEASAARVVSTNHRTLSNCLETIYPLNTRKTDTPEPEADDLNMTVFRVLKGVVL